MNVTVLNEQKSTEVNKTNIEKEVPDNPFDNPKIARFKFGNE